MVTSLLDEHVHPETRELYERFQRQCDRVAELKMLLEGPAEKSRKIAWDKELHNLEERTIPATTRRLSG